MQLTPLFLVPLTLAMDIPLPLSTVSDEPWRRLPNQNLYRGDPKPAHAKPNAISPLNSEPQKSNEWHQYGYEMRNEDEEPSWNYHPSSIAPKTPYPPPFFQARTHAKLPSIRSIFSEELSEDQNHAQAEISYQVSSPSTLAPITSDTRNSLRRLQEQCSLPSLKSVLPAEIFLSKGQSHAVSETSYELTRYQDKNTVGSDSSEASGLRHKERNTMPLRTIYEVQTDRGGALVVPDVLAGENEVKYSSPTLTY